MFVVELVLDFVDFHLEWILMYFFLFDINNMLEMG